jgi:hypothetical protein
MIMLICSLVNQRVPACVLLIVRPSALYKHDIVTLLCLSQLGIKLLTVLVEMTSLVMGIMLEGSTVYKNCKLIFHLSLPSRSCRPFL